jgi:hypothetical protein
MLEPLALFVVLIVAPVVAWRLLAPRAARALRDPDDPQPSSDHDYVDVLMRSSELGALRYRAYRDPKTRGRRPPER